MEYSFYATLKCSDNLLEVIEERLKSFSNEFFGLFKTRREKQLLNIDIAPNNTKQYHAFFEKYGEWPASYLPKMLLGTSRSFEFEMCCESCYDVYECYKIVKDDTGTKYYKQEPYQLCRISDIAWTYVNWLYLHFFFPDLAPDVEDEEWESDDFDEEEIENMVRDAINKRCTEFPDITDIMTNVFDDAEKLYEFLYNMLNGGYLDYNIDFDERERLFQRCKSLIKYCENNEKRLREAGIECTSLYDSLEYDCETCSCTEGVIEFSKKEFYDKYDLLECLYIYDTAISEPCSIHLNPPEWKECRATDLNDYI